MFEYKISSLVTTNFRNLRPLAINFNKNINCIFGDNGNGKTNILEAIYYLIYKKSFRKNSGFPQLLSIDSEKAQIIISSIFNKNNNETVSLSVKIENNLEVWSTNGQVGRLKNEINAVFINPFDAYNFYNQASFRRSWFDHSISVLNVEFKNSLKKYFKSLKLRNILLTNRPNKYLEQISAIDVELANQSEIITTIRVNFLKELNIIVNEIFNELFSEQHKIELFLDSKIINCSGQQIFKKMEENLKKDLLLGHTSHGIHLDDYTFLFNGLNSYEYCSLGQQKMSYLSLLFAYIELFRYKYSYPIVLIDDVSGELDKRRWSGFVKYLEKGKFQTLITTANENFKKELDTIDNVNKIFIKSGEVCNL